MIKPVFSYVSVVWKSLCSKVCLARILRLQKRAARIILDSNSCASSVPIFNLLHWLPLYNERITQCSILFKRIPLTVPKYLIA